MDCTRRDKKLQLGHIKIALALFRGKRRIYGGRGTLRTVLYMVALAAVKGVKADNVFKRLYLRIAATKPHKVGMVAVIAHSLVKNSEKWENKLRKVTP